MSNPLLVAKTAPNAVLPTKAHGNDVGYDFYCSEKKGIAAQGITNVQLGVRIKLPEGYWGLLVGRSSTSYVHGLFVIPGVIDPGYVGPMFVQVLNTKSHTVLIENGQRIAQLILIPTAGDRGVTEIEEVNLDDPEAYWNIGNWRRGKDGFGSSGN